MLGIWTVFSLASAWLMQTVSFHLTKERGSPFPGRSSTHQDSFSVGPVTCDLSKRDPYRLWVRNASSLLVPVRTSHQLPLVVREIDWAKSRAHYLKGSLLPLLKYQNFEIFSKVLRKF